MKFRPGKLLVTALIGACAVAVVIAAVSFGQAPQKKGAAGRRDADAPVPVLAASASLADVPVYLDGVGTTRALNMVTVRSQVDGILVKIAFREGQDVKRGDVLVQIDPTTYQAQLDQAVAKKALDE